MTDTQPNITLIRRANLLHLLQVFAASEVTAGQPAKGIEQRFAAALQMKPSMLSQIKSNRPISHKLARQIESLRAMHPGWLDEAHGVVGPSPAEEAFLVLCANAWRAQNAKGKRQLRRMVLDITLKVLAATGDMKSVS